MRFEYTVTTQNFTTAGEASSNTKKTLKLLGIDSKIIRKASIMAYEAEMNIAIHSEGGKILLDIEPGLITITALDQGPGIENIDLAMKEGYSTAPHEIREMGFGAGMGLPNMRRCADTFDITSNPGGKTCVVMTLTI
ncbi:MAG: anti-sigma regulatory factor [delta proteobacterium ML8_F1]|nr:MAG: anti-sigma regulatory factor [delta proteobacterium ML8_F1]